MHRGLRSSFGFIGFGYTKSTFKTFFDFIVSFIALAQISLCSPDTLLAVNDVARTHERDHECHGSGQEPIPQDGPCEQLCHEARGRRRGPLLFVAGVSLQCVPLGDVRERGADVHSAFGAPQAVLRLRPSTVLW